MERPSSGLIVLLIKLVLKLAKSAKVLLAGATFAAYASIFTWKFAIILMFALAIHESGHVYAMKKCGIKTKGFYFIPLVGGAAVAEEAFPSRSAEAYVALLGPLWGLGSALVIGLVYFFTLDHFYAAVCGWIALINFFNLLPVNPLDGGRVVKCLAFSAHKTFGYAFLILSCIVALIAAIYFKIFIMALLLVVCVIELVGELYSNRKEGQRILLGYNSPEEMLERYNVESLTSVPLYVQKRIDKYNKWLTKNKPMSKKAVVWSLLGYIGLCIIFLILIHLASSVPGSDILLTFLQ